MCDWMHLRDPNKGGTLGLEEKCCTANQRQTRYFPKVTLSDLKQVSLADSGGLRGIMWEERGQSGKRRSKGDTQIEGEKHKWKVGSFPSKKKQEITKTATWGISTGLVD